MTVELFQDFVTPPHWKARMKQQTPAMMVRVPSGSICKIFSTSGASMGLAFLGVWKIKNITKAEIPPIGRLI